MFDKNNWKDARRIFQFLSPIAAFLFCLWLYSDLHGSNRYDAVSFIALLIFPIIVWALFSGRLSELSGPGGWSAKFRDISEAPASADLLSADLLSGDLPADIVEFRNILRKGSVSQLINNPVLFQGGPQAVKFPLRHANEDETENKYSASVISIYLARLLALDSRALVVFTDEDDRLLCWTSASQFASLLSLSRNDTYLFETHEFEKQIIDALNHRDVNSLITLLAAKITKIIPKTTNAEAIKLMVLCHTDQIVAVDENGKPIGVIRREDILTKLLMGTAQTQ